MSSCCGLRIMPAVTRMPIVARVVERAPDQRQAVLRLVEVVERGRVERLEPDVQRAAAAVEHALHQRLVGQHVERDRTRPFQPQPLGDVAQLAQVAEVAGDVVVVEHRHAPAPVLQRPGDAALERLAQGDQVVLDARRGPRVEARAHAGEDAEIAGVRTATRDLERQREDLLVGHAMHQRRGCARGGVAARSVQALQLTARRVLVDVRHGVLGIAHHHRVEPRRAQVRVQRRHRPADHHLRAALAPVVRDLARAVELGMHARQEDEVVRLRPVGIDPGVVDDVDVGRVGQQRGDQRPDLRLQHAPVVRAAPVVVDEDGDDRDAHAVQGLRRRDPREARITSEPNRAPPRRSEGGKGLAQQGPAGTAPGLQAGCFST